MEKKRISIHGLLLPVYRDRKHPKSKNQKNFVFHIYMTLLSWPIGGRVNRYGSRLYRRKAHPGNLTVEIQRIDICHPGDIIEHALHLAINGGGMRVVLVGDALQQQFAVGMLLVHDGLRQCANQMAEDMITGQLDV